MNTDSSAVASNRSRMDPQTNRCFPETAQWWACSAPAPVKARTSSSVNLSSAVGSLDVTVPSQPKKKPSGIETMPGFCNGNQWKSTSAGNSDRLAPVTGANLSLFPAGVDFSWFPLENPGLVSIPLGFFFGWLGTVTSTEPESIERYDELEVRSLTGAGAEQAVVH